MTDWPGDYETTIAEEAARRAHIAGLREAAEILMDEGFVGESYRRILARIAELEKTNGS